MRRRTMDAEPEGPFKTRDDMRAEIKKASDKAIPELAHITTGLSAYDSYKACVYWYFPGHVTRLRVILKQHGKVGILQVAAKLEGIMQGEVPLHMTDQEFCVEGYQWKMSGRSVVSLHLAILWVLCNEDPVIMGGAMNDWPDLPLYANLSLPGRLELAKRYPAPPKEEKR